VQNNHSRDALSQTILVVAEILHSVETNEFLYESISDYKKDGLRDDCTVEDKYNEDL